MNFILAQFKRKCAETGVTVQKHEACLYDRATRKVYSKNSLKYKEELDKVFNSSFANA